MLEVNNIHSYYGDSHVLHGVSLHVKRGQCVAILGRNGAGKTTTLKSILGFLRPKKGRVIFRDRDITGQKTYNITRTGIGYVPEDRGIFHSLTVREHLDLAYAMASRRPNRRQPDELFDLFKRLASKKNNFGNQLSGGEQQILAIARALIPDPDLLILDEPSEGLAPVVIDTLEDRLLAIKQSGKTILLVEQNYGLAMRLADYVYVLGNGICAFHGTPDHLEANSELKHSLLGI